MRQLYVSHSRRNCASEPSAHYPSRTRAISHLNFGRFVGIIVEANAVAHGGPQNAIAFVGHAIRQGSGGDPSGLRDTDLFPVRAPSCFKKILKSKKDDLLAS